ncbi:MAG: nicotinate (nicotinamide) nucleotide adenylyltransferase [Chlamydiia bacterium]|nr:nicotinate (nicotinamide) nucleotide adenylyltransferase [Chlamydiia bacterium]
MRKIGFFGGSFDPIHFGHIYLALQLAEKHHLDEVLFCPAFCSPFKKGEPPRCNAHDRLKMLRLALKEVPHTRAISHEIDRGGISYTIDTLRALQQEQKGQALFHLLLSEETAEHLDQWKDFSDLMRIASPLVGMRPSSHFTFFDALTHLTVKLLSAFGMTQQRLLSLTPTKVLEISSTEIRDRLRRNLYCGHLVPAQTLAFIRHKQLYGSGAK